MNIARRYFRKNLLRLLAVIALSLTDGVGLQAQNTANQGRASLPASVRKVLFLGDSITYAGTYVVLVETYFVTRFPERTIEFIDAGLPSETVSGLTEDGHAGGKFPRPDLHERLGRLLEQIRPDLVVACYGMNDGIYLPLNEERFAKFRDGVEWLHGQVSKAGGAILHVTPPTFDEVKGGHAGYSAALGKYSDWLLAQRAAAGWDVVDLHAPMDAYLAERRKTDPMFAFAADGVHANEGHWIIARQILLHLGAKDLAGVTNAQGMVAAYPHGQALLKLVQQRQDIMKDAWLTATGHKRPGMNKGLPIAEAQAKGAEIEKEIRALEKAGG